MKTTSRNNIGSIIIIICLYIIIGFFISCIFIDVYNNFQENKKIMIYEQSFTNGIELGSSINDFLLRYKIGLINNTQYEAFQIMYNKFNEDPSFDNFSLLAHIIIANLNEVPSLEYGDDIEGFLDGVFVGDTKKSMEIIHQNKKISNEMYEEYLCVLGNVLDHPSHEKVEIYTEFLSQLIKKL